MITRRKLLAGLCSAAGLLFPRLGLGRSHVIGVDKAVGNDSTVVYTVRFSPHSKRLVKIDGLPVLEFLFILVDMPLGTYTYLFPDLQIYCSEKIWQRMRQVQIDGEKVYHKYIGLDGEIRHLGQWCVGKIVSFYSTPVLCGDQSNWDVRLAVTVSEMVSDEEFESMFGPVG